MRKMKTIMSPFDGTGVRISSNMFTYRNNSDFIIFVFNFSIPLFMKKVAYIYNDSTNNFNFNKEHPMKPRRIKMTDSLVKNYHLCDHLNMFQCK